MDANTKAQTILAIRCALTALAGRSDGATQDARRMLAATLELLREQPDLDRELLALADSLTPARA